MKSRKLTGIDANAVFRSELAKLGQSDPKNLPLRTIVDLTARFAIWIPTATYAESPWIAPFAVRKARLRVEPHAPGDVRDLWGTPTEEGFFTDDNSLIKPLVLGKKLLNPASPYGSSSISKGLVCCHIWPGTTADPLRFSFIPNLVWLPRDLAPLTDAHGMNEPHPLHDFLKVISRQRYESSPMHADATQVRSTWKKLAAPIERFQQLEPVMWNEVADPNPLNRLVRRRTSRIVKFLDRTTSSGPMPNPFSKRYHAGVGPKIDSSVFPIQSFVPVEVREKLSMELRTCVSALA